MGFLYELGSELAIARVIEIRLKGFNLAEVYDFFKAYYMVQRTLIDRDVSKEGSKTASAMTTFLLPSSPAYGGIP